MDLRAGAVACALVFFLVCAQASELSHPVSSYAVRDSIALSNPIWPGHVVAGERFDRYQRSPDGRSFLIVVRKGNLDLGLNEFALLRYDVAALRAFVNRADAKSLPRPEPLALLRTALPGLAIQSLRWSANGQSLFFIGRGTVSNEVAQIFRLDLKDRSLHQLTHQPRDVQSYELAANAPVFVYAAQGALERSAREAHGYVVEGETLTDVMNTDIEGYSRPSRYFALDYATGRQVDLDIVSAETRTGVTLAEKVVVSPDGKRAVMAIGVETYPKSWDEYESWPAPPPQRNDAVFGKTVRTRRQLRIVDLTTGKSAALMDTPAAMAEISARSVAWSPDGREIAISRAFSQHSKRVVLVDAQTREVREIGEFSTADRYPPQVHFNFPPEVQWLSARAVRLRENRELDSETGPVRAVTITRADDGRWIARESRQTLTDEEGASSLVLRRVEDLQQPPELEATDPATGTTRRISAFNAEVRQRVLPTVERFQWQDRFGQSHEDGIVLPPDFRPGTRYALVIQSHMFLTDVFDIQAANSGAAARPLASRGIVVVQSPCGISASPEQMRKHGEWGVAMMCYEDIIDTLDRRGMIDRTRVGLSGFSRTGMYVQYAVTFAKFPIAAALIADSVQASPWNYVMNYGQPQPGMKEWDDPVLIDDNYVTAMIGAPPYGRGLTQWLRCSPALNLERVRAAVRYESHGNRLPPNPWDVFAISRRMHKPVELLIIPNDGHDLETPFGRYTSQQGAVDWYAFWLNGEERPEPQPGTPETVESLAQQYRRWRALRAEHELQPAHIESEIDYETACSGTAAN